MALINHIDESHDYKVSIPWTRPPALTIVEGRQELWNEAAAWAIERFGLPGTAYTCRLSESGIEFWFEKEQDALLFQIRWSS